MTDTPEIELRIALDPETLLGPGKAALLQAIDETGSIAAAGRRMGTSYKRAWYLIDTMNVYFSEPVVISTKGGNSRGGARLTATGRKFWNPTGGWKKDAQRHRARPRKTLRSRCQKSPLTRPPAGVWFPI